MVTNAAEGGKEPARTVKLDDADLMRLEFGRLLGEPQQKTLSKIVKKKLNPDATYVGLEKLERSGNESLKRSAAKSDPLNYRIRIDKPKRAAVDDSLRLNASSAASDLPHLASPPLRQNGTLGKFFQSVQAGSKSTSLSISPQLNTPESVDESLLRKPSLKGSSTGGMTTYLHIRPQIDTPESVDESFLRNPPLKQSSTGDMTGMLATGKVTLPLSVSTSKKTVLLEMECSDDDNGLLRRPLVTNADKDGNENTSVLNEAVNKSLLSASEDSQIRLSKEKPSWTPELEVSPISQENETSQESEQKFEELLDKSFHQIPDQILSAHTPMQWNSENNFTQMLDVTESGQHVSGTSLGQFIDGESFATIDQEKLQMILDGPSVKAKLSSDTRALTRPNLKFSRPDPSSGLANPNKFNDVSSAVQQSRVENVVGENISGARSPIEMPSLDEEGVCASPIKLSRPKLSNDLATAKQLHDDKSNATQESRGENRESENISVARSPKEIQSLDEEEVCQSPIKLSRPKPSNGLTYPNQSSNKTSNATHQSRMLILNSEKSASVARSPVETPSLDEEVVSVSARSMSDFPEEAKHVPELQSEIFSESNLDMKNSLQEGASTSTIQLPIHSFAKLQKGPSRVVGNPEDGLEENLATVNLSETNSLANVPTQEQDFLMHSQVHEIKQQLMKEPEPLRRPMQPQHPGSTLLQSKETFTGTVHLDEERHSGTVHVAKDDEERDWMRAEALLKSKEQEDVRLTGSNSAGLFVSFGCLVGFLPIYELSPKRGLVEFSSWAEEKGFDVSRTSAVNNIGGSNTAQPDIVVTKNGKGRLVTEGELQELWNKYSDEMTKLTSSFIGKKARVIVKSVDKNAGRLKVSEREADADSRELTHKKADLMAELKIGDVVTCEVRNITPMGIFVDLRGVSALIHQSEVSWNARVDPSSLFRVGEVVNAKVCRLDRVLQRINLSLKRMQPDPLLATLESVVRDSENEISMHDSQSLEPEVAVWPELEALITKLEQMEQIACVTKGRCLRSAALAPTFQVFLSVPQENGYKLLARFGNKIQEVLVNTTLDREKMKESIRICTFAEST